jgi:hypothetical protein
MEARQQTWQLPGTSTPVTRYAQLRQERGEMENSSSSSQRGSRYAPQQAWQLEGRYFDELEMKTGGRRKR